MEEPIPYNAGGRPPKDPEQKRSKMMKCYLTPDEYSYLKLKCDLAGVSQSDFLRMVALEKVIKSKANPEELKKIRAELGQIGSNINQIAKAVNQGKRFREEDFKKLTDQLLEKLEEL
jgi:hypothetical protein